MDQLFSILCVYTCVFCSFSDLDQISRGEKIKLRLRFVFSESYDPVKFKLSVI